MATPLSAMMTPSMATWTERGMTTVAAWERAMMIGCAV